MQSMQNIFLLSVVTINESHTLNNNIIYDAFVNLILTSMKKENNLHPSFARIKVH